MIVASFGILGAVLAATVSKHFDWQTAYYIGGVMGIMLLFLRIGVYESGMYKATKKKNISKGNIFQLFNSKVRFVKYISSIAVGMPIWFVIGILITFSPEFGVALGIKEPILAGNAVMYAYLGLSAGDFISAYFSQFFKSRKKITIAFLILCSLFIPLYLWNSNSTSTYLYSLCLALGFASGYWAVFVTIASEQFGTNIRSTVTTTAPNFVRGAVVLLTSSFSYLKGSLGIVNSALVVGALTMLIAFVSLLGLEETYGKDLNYVEEDL
jgi:MFS transporter, putative metabolite:H+ symporter